MYRTSLPFRLRRRTLALGLVSSCAILGLSGRAAAQAEAQKPTPNVLLLVDSSGSMEFKTDGTFPTCTPGNTTLSQKSRWINLVEVLTGTINNYSCWAQDRSSLAFKNEYLLDGHTPYDFGYINPYHRALSNSCIYGPGTLPPASTPFLFPNGAVTTYPFAAGAVSRTQPDGCSPKFSQAGDGLLDIYKDEVRFGLMTFDARVHGGTGVNASTGAVDYTPDIAGPPLTYGNSGIEGNWSYPPLGPTRLGHPANCITSSPQEVGARNAAAPPWEGRMVAFGPPDLADNTQRNTWIQQVLLSTRPYGATPIAGQLFDAQHFLFDDHDPDPFNAVGETYEFGPSLDRNWGANNCRKTILILLTDGEPNLDLRPFCEAQPPDVTTGGVCPYEKPEEIVRQLRESPPQPSMSVETYVIGFALGSVRPFHPPLHPAVECKNLDLDAECGRLENNNFTTYPDGKAVQACCTLNKIAAAGGFDATGVVGRKAYFANDAAQLKAIFTDILDDVVQVATRTMPVFASSAGDSQSNGFKFFSAFDPQPDPAEPQLWQGKLERHRFVCDELEPEEQYSPARGDDFAGNVNDNGDDRWFYTVVGSGGLDNRKTIRPELLLDNDGLGLSSGTQVFASDRSALKGVVPASAMQVTATTCTAAPTADGCRDLILDHLVGLTTPGQPSRCPNGVCRLFGGIYHSTPTVVPGKPGEFLRDESYQAFGKVMAADARPSVLYTSTVDGFLHAFNLAPFPGSDDAEEREINSPGNNELWSFIPPAVLPVLQTQYPSTPATLLDGVPIIKDVVATESTGRFERVAANAQAGTGEWRSVLLQGFGEGMVDGGYFALDITRPDRDDGPKFLWQLTRDAAGAPLFGNGGTPLITTVFINATGGAREVAVAVLPGGDLASPGGATVPSGPEMATDPTEYRTSRPVRNYAGMERARSLTIVRLDTGEVVRTFRPAIGTFNSTVFTETNIPAPITGQPKAYPENTGAVADRIFVGDRDGRLWRVDVSSKDPAAWSMEIFFDAFHDYAAADAGKRQPVILPPVLSVTDTGAVTVNFATGDQQVTSAPSTMVNRVLSLTEQLNDAGDAFEAHLNWIHELTDGERVTGPMVLFNTGLYYAVSRPPNTTTAACDVGRSKVFGTHYLDSADTQAENDPISPLSGPGKAPGLTDKLIATRTDGLIFGLSLQAEPTCSSTPETIAGNESFGTQEVTLSTTVKPGKMFLSYNVSGTSAGTSGVEQVKKELADPAIPVTFQSWALVYE